MTSRHQRVESLFLDCLDLEPGKRAAFLDAQCAGDAALRADVEALLARDARPETSLPAPPWGGGEPRTVTPPPAVIGPYRIVEKLGEGGFGEVYAADQVSPVRRRVALKLLKPGMDSRDVLARFEAERQALALMDHPGIAKVHDAGVAESGRPYFVMELVDGESITDFCDRRGLGTRERLRLFIAVCRAVEHAHQKGVTHRDIKPSNILVSEVDGDPRPRVIDFGIAKAAAGALEGETLHTHAGAFLGTPEYMSPEQASSGGVDVDTRTDVYALGVVLYRLLTGKLPFDSERLRRAGIADVSRILREEEPARPSDAVRELRGDLDWIVLRAMEKERERRYTSAAALADDIERHLADEPVLAGPPSTSYRMRKLARRHRALVAGSIAVIAALVVGLAATIFQAVRARHAEEEARRQADVATAVNNFLTQMLAEANPVWNPRGLDVTVREIVDRAAAQLRTGESRTPEVEAGIAHTLGTTYSGLGLYDEAMLHLNRAVEVRSRVVGRLAPETLESWLSLREVEALAGRYAAAESALSSMDRELRDADFRDPRLRARFLQVRGGTLGNLGRLDEADTLLHAAAELRRNADPPDPSSLAAALIDLTAFYSLQGRWEDAETVGREALAVARGAHAGDHRDVANAAGHLASVLRRAGKFPEAEALLRESIEIDRRVLGPEHSTVAQSLNNLSVLLVEVNRLEEAEAIQRESVELLRRSMGEDNVLYATALASLANVLQQKGKPAEALEYRLQSLAIDLAMLGERHPSVAVDRNNLASVYRLLGRYDEAAEEFRQAITILREVHGEHPDLAVALHNLAKTLLDAGRVREADPYSRQALEHARRVFPADHVNVAIFETTRGRALLEVGRREEAEPLLRHAHERILAVLGPDHPRVAEVEGLLAKAAR